MCFVLFTFDGGYRCVLFCLHLWRIPMYFVLFTFMEDINVIFVYIYGGYRCNFVLLSYAYGGYRCILFCLHLWRISM